VSAALVTERLRGVARRLKATVAPRAVILLYHRVADVPAGTDPHDLCVSPLRFAEQMEVLRRQFTVLPMSKLASEIAGGRMPYRSVAVTFDDGYADNLETAKPILERHDIPATVFATTGEVGRTEEFYWDECERLFQTVAPRGRRLRLGTPDVDREWTLGAPGSPARRRALLEVCEVIRGLAPEERRCAVTRIRGWAGASAEVRPTHRAMTDDELACLSSGGLIEVGAHTENHPALTELPWDQQLAEIANSKSRLEAVLGRAVEGFAYPYGLHDARSVDAAQSAGFRWACTTEEHAARHASEPLRLPRFDLGNCDGDAFERTLWRAFGR
jgi:peptidoglycan/xylan/chitin deacetylase (PgdA/CDA1 family)